MDSNSDLGAESANTLFRFRILLFSRATSGPSLRLTGFALVARDACRRPDIFRFLGWPRFADLLRLGNLTIPTYKRSELLISLQFLGCSEN